MPTPARPAPPGRPPHHARRSSTGTEPRRTPRHIPPHDPTHQPPTGTPSAHDCCCAACAVGRGPRLPSPLWSSSPRRPSPPGGGGAPTPQRGDRQPANWIVGILAGVATLFLTIGGLRYLTAGGDPGQVEKAKTALKSAAIGYALAILAPLLVSILASIVGG